MTTYAAWQVSAMRAAIQQAQSATSPLIAMRRMPMSCFRMARLLVPVTRTTIVAETMSAHGSPFRWSDDEGWQSRLAACGATVSLALTAVRARDYDEAGKIQGLQEIVWVIRPRPGAQAESAAGSRE